MRKYEHHYVVLLKNKLNNYEDIIFKYDLSKVIHLPMQKEKCKEIIDRVCNLIESTYSKEFENE